MSHDTPTGWVKPARSLVTAAGRAIGDYRMIRDGDRILLGLSGGKDSLSLLHTLHHLQQKAPVKFELLACTVDPQSD
ncbi:MAG: tRNA 2-thiocytidine biosynthesis protein TtcA, partial [Thiobacillus sp.]|nr:tRNA 2-thiocytidine biosynthesis protein TtcA [Thiobacillus sp.]